MKTLPVAYAILVACTLVARADLQLHWPLDEASGTVVADASGNGLDGGWQGSAGSVGWLPDGGVDGGAVEFSGADRDSFITSNFSAVDGTPFTLSAWVKTESSAKDGLVYLGDGSTGSSYYLMQIQGGNAKTVARNTSETAATGPDINDGEWHHVVCVFAGTTARRVYTDGVLRNTSDTNVPEVSLNRFGIGALTRNSPHTPVDLYTGQLDDVALWDRAFSISDIAALRGLALHGAGNAGDLEAFAAAFALQQPVLVRGQNWDYATGLTGGIGAAAGSIGDGDASIVLDGSGNGMRLAGSTEPSVVSFGADHPAVAPGVPVTLSWQTFNADSASIGGIGSVDPSAGSITVTPAATTTYTLSVSGDDGSAQAEVTVTVSSSPVDPQISEFLAMNETGLRDDDGARSDWIEMHNPSGFALDLFGYKLTNDAGVLPMWSFPPLVLASGEYLVVFASAKDRTVPGAPLHTNFSLDADGSYLALVRPDGSTVVQEFAPVFPAQRDDLSYSAAGFHSPPTPGEENSAGAQAGILQKKVTFGTPGGLFFGGTVNLSLSHVDVAATIRYTLDGSVPDASSAAYTAPIPITSTTLVKAAVFRPDYIPGPLSQEGYIFADPELSGFDSNLPILVIDTFDTAVPRGDRAFKDAAFATFDPSANTGRAALADAQSEGGNSGIHVRGESSQLSGFNKLNFAFETRNTEGDDKDVSLFGMPADSDWALHASEIDRTFIREQLPHLLMREIGRYSPRTRPVEVFLNQDGGPVSASDYRGVYIVVERIRRNDDRVDIAKLEADESTAPDITGGYIFKRDKSDPGDVRVSTSGEGSFAITYPNGENITTAQRDYLQTYLREFEAALHGASFSDPVTGYAAYIDVPSWVDMHVIQELTKEVDSYVFSTFYYKDKNGKIVCGPLWDFDRAFGNVNSGGVDDPEGWRGGPGGERGSFWERLFEGPDFEQLFIDRWQELMGGTLAESNLHAIIDQMAAEVDEAQDRNFEPAGPWPLADVTRSHLTFPTYDQHVTYLKDWISDRLSWVQAQFTAKPQFNQAPGSYGAPFNLGLSSQGGTIFYTTDGSDPRSPGGGVAGTTYSGAIPISQTTSVIARVRDGMDWSGPIIGHFILGEPASSANLVVSEIMYHPAGASASEVAAGFADEESFEFIEFTNIGANPVELSGVTVSEAFDFSFPVFEIAPGGRVLLVRDRAAFDFRYGQVGSVLGEYGDSKLSNGGEQIVIRAADGQVIRDFAFDDSSPWPEAADGDGFSLVLIDPMSVPAHGDPSNWRASGFVGGSPAGTDTTRFVGDPGADGNRNGLSDLIEYAIGDTLSSGFSDSGFITFRQNLLADDVLVSVEVSDDLATWQSGPDAVVRSRMDHHGDGTATVVWESVAPTARSQFMRVRVTTR